VAGGRDHRPDAEVAGGRAYWTAFRAAHSDAAAEGVMVPRVISVVAGLGSRDVAAGDIVAVFDKLAEHEGQPGRFFVVGVKHSLALQSTPLDLRPDGAYSLRGHSIGGFGSVTTNKLVATLTGELFHKFVQAYPRYGSEKKGLPTTYYLTIADEPIRVHAELDLVDFVPLHDVSAFRLGDPLAGLVGEGDLFIQSPLSDPEAIWLSIPADARARLLARHIRVTALDTAAIARRHAPRPDLQVRMQGVALVGVFLRVSPFAARANLDRDRLLEAVGEQLGRFFGKRGGVVVDANLQVIAEAYDSLIDVSVAVLATAGSAYAGAGAAA